jgi:hypothetical protein
MISVDELKQKFPVKDVPPYGECIVILGVEFDPDWETELGDRGYKCINTGIDSKQVTLVQLKKSVVEEGEKVVYVPPATVKASPFQRWSSEEDEKLVELWNAKLTVKEIGAKFPSRGETAVKDRLSRLRSKRKVKSRNAPQSRRVTMSQSDNVTKSPQEQVGLQRVLKGKDTPLGPRWTEDEYKLLIKLWNERKKIREIAAKFPSRSGHAVGSALGRLKNSGAIKPRWSQKKNRLSKVGAEPEPAPMQPSADKSVHAPAPVTLDKLASDVKGILDVLDVQGRVLDKLFCALLMQAVEVKQEKGDLSIPPGLWVHYANALLEEDKQFREKFRLKVEQLLEASS